MRRTSRWVALALVVVTAVFGSINAYDELGDGETLLQKSVGVAVTAYAVASWLVLFAVWRRRRWGVGAAVAWALSTAYAASVSSYAYGEAPLFSVALAGITCLALGWWVVWAVRESVQPPVASPQTRV